MRRLLVHLLIVLVLVWAATHLVFVHAVTVEGGPMEVQAVCASAYAGLQWRQGTPVVQYKGVCRVIDTKLPSGPSVQRY